MEKMESRRALVDDLNRVIGLLPKGYRGGLITGRKYEYGPKGNDGIRHVQGIGTVRTIRVESGWYDELNMKNLAI